MPSAIFHCLAVSRVTPAAQAKTDAGSLDERPASLRSGALSALRATRAPVERQDQSPKVRCLPSWAPGTPLPYNQKSYTYNCHAHDRLIRIVWIIYKMNVPAEDQSWLPRLEKREGPIYLAIADAISEAVSAGELRPGERLQTHRAMAEALDVDLTTVTRAYAEARRRGVLEATVGRGTFVRTERKGSASSSTGRQRSGALDLSMNLPPQPAPPLNEALQRGFSSLLARPDISELLTYRSGSGTSEERTAGAAWLLPTVGEVDPERVLVSSGAQPALLAILGMVARPGDIVLVDSFTYPGTAAPLPSSASSWSEFGPTRTECCRMRWRKPAERSQERRRSIAFPRSTTRQP